MSKIDGGSIYTKGIPYPANKTEELKDDKN